MRTPDVAPIAVPEATRAVAIETVTIAERLKIAAEAMLDGSATDEMKYAVHAHHRLARGIPEEPLHRHPVVALNLEGAIEQARGLQTVVRVHDADDGHVVSETPRDFTLAEKADWLRWQALKLDPRFEGVPESSWESAVKPPTKRGSLAAAGALLAEVGIHPDVAGLAADLKSDTKRGGRKK